MLLRFLPISPVGFAESIWKSVEKIWTLKLVLCRPVRKGALLCYVVTVRFSLPVLLLKFFVGVSGSAVRIFVS